MKICNKSVAPTPPDDVENGRRAIASKQWRIKKKLDAEIQQPNYQWNVHILYTVDLLTEEKKTKRKEWNSVSKLYIGESLGSRFFPDQRAPE